VIKHLVYLIGPPSSNTIECYRMILYSLLMALLDGNAIAANIREDLRQQIAAFSGRPPCLAVILVGDSGPSRIYVNRKTKACEEVGIHSIRRHLEASVSEDELLKEIEHFNVNPEVDGILVQLPLPDHINESRVTRWIHPEKDVDGFHPINVGKMLIGETDGFFPCTPLGVQALIEHTGISLPGKHVVIVGRSNIVGKPLAAMLLQRGRGIDVTVTVAHRYTDNLKEISLSADILVVAIGVPHHISADMIREGAVVIDVGINRVEDLARKSGSRLVGDVDFEGAQDKCAYITPVPGGVGPMTIAMLLKNTLKSYQSRRP